MFDPPVGACMGATDQCFFHVDVSLSLPLSLKINPQVKKKKKRKENPGQSGAQITEAVGWHCPFGKRLGQPGLGALRCPSTARRCPRPPPQALPKAAVSVPVGQ